MAVLEHSARPQAGFFAVLVTRAVRLGASVFRASKNRQQFRRLREMSDWELADIGLCRDDLHNAWKRRVETDPMHYLNAVARSRAGLEDAARRIS
mgnify:CR=1 FL=1